MKMESTLTRDGVCANCGGRGCDQCRTASANNQCTICGGKGCEKCRQPTKAKGLDELTEVACYVAQTNPHNWTMPTHLLSLSLIDCGDDGSMLLLSIMPDKDEPETGWESAAMIIGLDWWKHLQHTPEPPDHFSVTTSKSDDGPKMSVVVMIPKVWDAMSFFELSMSGVNVVGWANASDGRAH